MKKLNLLFALFLFYSCSVDKENKIFFTPQNFFKTVEFAKFSIQDSVDVQINTYIKEFKNNLYCVAQNIIQDSIIVLSNKNEILSNISLKKVTESFLLTSYNNILYLPNKQQFIVIVEDGKGIIILDKKGEVIKDISFSKDFSNFKYKEGISTVFLANSPYDLFYCEGNLFFPMLGYWKFDNTEIGSTDYFKQYYQQPVFGILDTENYKLSLSTIHFPTSYQKIGLRRYNYTHPFMCFNEKSDLSVVSFGTEKEVQIYNKDKFEKDIKFSSDFIKDKDIYLAPSNASPAELIKYFIEVASYSTIHYDKYRKLYYRIALHSMPYESEDGMTTHTFEDKPFSIVVLNENFEKIDETQLDETIYYPEIHIVEEGVLIKNKTKSEKKKQVTFELFKINY